MSSKTTVYNHSCIKLTKFKMFWFKLVFNKSEYTVKKVFI